MRLIKFFALLCFSGAILLSSYLPRSLLGKIQPSPTPDPLDHFIFLPIVLRGHPGAERIEIPSKSVFVILARGETLEEAHRAERGIVYPIEWLRKIVAQISPPDEYSRDWYVVRSYISFDTSEIAGRKVVSATLLLIADSHREVFDIAVHKGEWEDPPSLSDFNEFGSLLSLRSTEEFPPEGEDFLFPLPPFVALEETKFVLKHRTDHEEVPSHEQATFFAFVREWHAKLIVWLER
jgi:hypothetical protein